jgi:RNA polymerase sigma-70 factor, ECF subfamily
MTGLYARQGGSMSEAAKSPGLTPGAGVEESRELQARFVQENLRRIFLQIYRIVGNVDDAQDLTQETFIKALQRQDQIKDLDKATHWLSRVASNTAIDFLRRHGRISYSDIDDLPQPITTEPEDSPERLLLRAEQASYLEHGLRLLSARERTALILRDVDGLPAEDVAKELNCSKATVRSHIANARIKFRRYLERRKA